MDLRRFPHYLQHDLMDCGPTCLQIIAKYYGKSFKLSAIRDKSYIDKQGVSFENISIAAEEMGMDVLCVKLPFESFTESDHLPCIVHWNQNHFIVVYKINKDKIFVSDQASGRMQYSHKEFKRLWCLDKNLQSEYGVALFLEPTAFFYRYSQSQNKHSSLQYGLRYVLAQRFDLFLLAILLGIISLIHLIVPLLTQQIIDKGVVEKDFRIVSLLLIAQLVLYFGQLVAEFIRQIALRKLSNKVNLSILSQFLGRMILLPMRFFDRKKIGDILQRMQDHERIERLINSSSLNLLFAFVNFIVYGVILLNYSTVIFTIFLSFTLIYFSFATNFQKARAILDYKRFAFLSQNRTTFMQILSGIQEIKLHNCEQLKRLEWEREQEKINQLTLQTAKLQQWQESGSGLINEIKNVLITLTAAQAVITGDITLGMMMATQYIAGQLNVPIHDFMNFIRDWQDAKISVQRIDEVKTTPTEAEAFGITEQSGKYTNKFTLAENIVLNKISFQFNGPNSPKVLDGVDLEILAGKVTAVVGSSGSGKTTLLKILAKIYPPTAGMISVGGRDFSRVVPNDWRNTIGVVMQEGFIFNDSILGNICLRDKDITPEMVTEAVETANISELVKNLPQGLDTQIGADGHGLSTGQKQRLLIARAIYHNPNYLFLDEATGSLDANNERTIIENLQHFFKGRTVVIVAHRLSTVRHADKIVVMDKGKIVEEGNHENLIALRGMYYKLVKNQLELGQN